MGQTEIIIRREIDVFAPLPDGVGAGDRRDQPPPTVQVRLAQFRQRRPNPLLPIRAGHYGWSYPKCVRQTTQIWIARRREGIHPQIATISQMVSSTSSVKSAQSVDEYSSVISS